MSSQRLAAVVAVRQAGLHGPGGQQPLRGEQRPQAVNLFITSVVLGGVLVAACLTCWCCSRARGRGARGSAKAPPRDTPIYTVQADYPQQAQCYEMPLPPYRRPPTPGPPPAYDSVVSQADQFRRFGKDEDYSDELDKIQQYCSDDTTTYREVLADSMSSLEKLRHCKVEGSCSHYNRIDGDVNTDSNGSFSSSEEVYKLSRKHFSEHHTRIGPPEQMTSFCSGASDDHIIIEIDSVYLEATEREDNFNVTHSNSFEDVGEIQQELAEYEVVRNTIPFGEANEREETLDGIAKTEEHASSVSQETDSEPCGEEAAGLSEDAQEEDDEIKDSSLPSYETALSLEAKTLKKKRSHSKMN